MLRFLTKRNLLLEDVISSGNYTLTDDYSKLFAAHQENNEESIFEIQTSTKSGNTNWGNIDAGEGAMWVTFCGPRQLKNSPDYDNGYGFCLLLRNCMIISFRMTMCVVMRRYLLTMNL